MLGSTKLTEKGLAREAEAVTMHSVRVIPSAVSAFESPDTPERAATRNLLRSENPANAEEVNQHASAVLTYLAQVARGERLYGIADMRHFSETVAALLTSPLIEDPASLGAVWNAACTSEPHFGRFEVVELL